MPELACANQVEVKAHLVVQDVLPSTYESRRHHEPTHRRASTRTVLVATTIYHEVVPTVDCRLCPARTLLRHEHTPSINFLSRWALFSLPPWSDVITGSLLSVLTTTECMPIIQTTQRDAIDTLMFLLCFTIGGADCFFLNHGYCEPREGG
jgi:hypothetical protein